MPRGAKPTQFTPEQVAKLYGSRSHADLAREFGMSDMPIRRWRRKHGYNSLAHQRPAQPPAGPLGTPGISQSADGEQTVTSPPIEGGLQTNDAEGYLRKRWGFPADKWVCLSAKGNEWQGPRAGGETVTYAQVKGSFRPIQQLVDLLPAPAAIERLHERRPLPRPMRRDRAVTHSVIVADHQAPYIDDALHAATLAMIEGIRPAYVGHIGDLCDYTNISKHRDHAVVKAGVDECTQAGVDVLYDLRRAAPNARIQILKGNHDVRPLTELLLRAERMAGIRPGSLPGDAEAREELISLRLLWRLDDLDIELVDDDRGWEHAELDIVPGPHGLAAVHGWLTGANVAARTLEKVGRSVLIGHTHGPEHVFKWSPQLRIEQQAMVVGCQCEVRGGAGKSFPTFAARDGWLQGPAVVTTYPDGEFAVQRARWNGESLIVPGHGRWAA